MNVEQLNKFIQFMTEVRDGASDFIKQNEHIKSLEEDIEDYKKELITSNEKAEELEEDMEQMEDVETIELSGGIIKVNIDELDYMTKESFKAWCRVHAITNSEPVFNL